MQVDVWAMGVLAYELFTGFPAFEHESRTVTYKRILHAEPQYTQSVPTLARDFIKKALVKVRDMLRWCLGDGFRSRDGFQCQNYSGEDLPRRCIYFRQHTLTSIDTALIRSGIRT